MARVRATDEDGAHLIISPRRYFGRSVDEYRFSSASCVLATLDWTPFVTMSLFSSFLI